VSQRTPISGTATLSLSAQLAAAPPGVRAQLTDQLRTVVSTLSDAPVPQGRSDLVERFEQLLAPADPSAVWLALSVLDGELPTAADVQRVVRAIRLDGVATAFSAPASRLVRTWLLGPRRRPEVRVLRGAVLVDMEHTARTGLATGIQRVARETVKRWARDHELSLVGWDSSLRNLRLLDEGERDKALTGSGRPRPQDAVDVLVVPWESTYLLPELSPERERNARIGALAQFSRSRTGVIGFDCVPITSAETTALGVSEAFATNLAAVRHMDRVSAISRAAATEYGGWRSMLASVGAEGPRISAELLPAEVPPSSPADLEAARSLLTIPGVPMVLCVGTHEPRKNHLALLHAAELLWRDGVRFSLVLVGGRSWNDEGFREALAEARARNRPVETPSGISDQVLWAGYRIARCTVFPSLNEGFGLPVAESLASGTPAITSGYGSMAEIAADGGALLVDPRDDRSIAAGLRTLLTDDATHAELSAAARARPARSWDQYAAEVWSALTDAAPAVERTPAPPRGAGTR
jgi:glycosyltransferase involved in cell wall biosynthesis